jgi:rhomboid protease GluP
MIDENIPETGVNRPPTGPGYRVSIRMAARKAWVSYSFIGLSICVFLLQLFTQSSMGIDLPAAYGAKVNSLIIQGQFWRFLTPVLLHGSIAHIAFNMYALFTIGPGLEQHYGHWRFLGLYILSGFAGNVISFWMSPNPSLGASTAIFGLVAAEAVFVLQNRFLFGPRARSILMNILTIIGINLFLGLSPGIDNWGHLGGLMGGLAFAWLGGPVYSVTGSAPDLHIVNNRPSNQTWTVGAVVTLVFLVLAWVKIITS